jgi:hypothetical protein
MKFMQFCLDSEVGFDSMLHSNRFRMCEPEPSSAGVCVVGSVHENSFSHGSKLQRSVSGRYELKMMMTLEATHEIGFCF